MKDQLLKFITKPANRNAYLADTGLSQREFDCLVDLVEDGTISTWEQLEEYWGTISVEERNL